MVAERLLSRLDKARQLGRGRWIACCPAHDDRRPSLSITEADDGRVLIHCFGQQCSVGDIVAAVGMELHDLFPPRPDSHYLKPVRRPFSAEQLLQVIDRESIVACITTVDALKQGFVEAAEFDRVMVARSRLAEVLRHV